MDRRPYGRIYLSSSNLIFRIYPYNGTSRTKENMLCFLCHINVCMTNKMLPHMSYVLKCIAFDEALSVATTERREEEPVVG